MCVSVCPWRELPVLVRGLLFGSGAGVALLRLRRRGRPGHRASAGAGTGGKGWGLGSCWGRMGGGLGSCWGKRGGGGLRLEVWGRGVSGRGQGGSPGPTCVLASLLLFSLRVLWDESAVMIVVLLILWW